VDLNGFTMSINSVDPRPCYASNTNTIARLERDEIRDPGSQLVLRLARALNTSTDYLLGRDEQIEESDREPAVASSLRGPEHDGS
jgi:transcriptional regulator with XRE-family HTH domain